MLAALCFGSIFGLPFIAWGVILIVDRDRTWRRKLQRSRDESPPRRTRAWDQRQIIYGSLLVVFGATVLLLFSIFNYLAQAISPPAPF
ncbi:MAG: hypothetical protein OXG53_03090 [Chloroflexi bacterium]|nr:hypothetical protein [Chloroflexota bacterium]